MEFGTEPLVAVAGQQPNSLGKVLVWGQRPPVRVRPPRDSVNHGNHVTVGGPEVPVEEGKLYLQRGGGVEAGPLAAAMCVERPRGGAHLLEGSDRTSAVQVVV